MQHMQSCAIANQLLGVRFRLQNVQQLLGLACGTAVPALSLVPMKDRAYSTFGWMLISLNAECP